MRRALLAALLVASAAPASVRAISLDDACKTFQSKLSATQASADSAKAQEIYQKGRQRIASKFNGATCPNVKAPTP